MNKLSHHINWKNTINTKNWSFFYINDLFVVSGTVTTKKEFLKLKGIGDFPYVTTAATNNGVEGYYNFFTEKGKVLVVDSAVGGYMSYQDVDFSASDHVEKLTPKFEINKYIGLFICCVWNSSYSFKKYNYTLKASQKMIKKEKIYLPVDSQGNPDWKFMEEYVRERERELLALL